MKVEHEIALENSGYHSIELNWWLMKKVRMPCLDFYFVYSTHCFCWFAFVTFDIFSLSVNK